MSVRAGTRARQGLFALILLAILAQMLVLNAHTPLMMDDYDYSFSWSTGERIDGIADVLASQAAHYRLWGGRSVVHALAQLFLWLGKPVFNIANAVMYVLLLLELLALSGCGWRRADCLRLLLAHGVLLSGVSFFGTVFLWLDGACNYLWGTALVASPQISDRAFTGVLALVLAAALALPMPGWLEHRRRAAAAAALAAAAVLVGAQAAREVYAHGQAWSAQLARINAACAAGETEVTLDCVPSHSRFTMDIRLAGVPQDWPNSTLSRYFGIDVRGDGACGE